jgi:hypothetical protein
MGSEKTKKIIFIHVSIPATEVDPAHCTAFHALNSEIDANTVPYFR